MIPSSSPTNDENETSKKNLLALFLQHETFQSIHKLFDRRSFCDPYHPHDSDSDDDEDTTTIGLTSQMEVVCTATQQPLALSPNHIATVSKSTNSVEACESKGESSCESTTSQHLQKAVVTSQDQPTSFQATTEQQEKLDPPIETFDNEFELQETEVVNTSDNTKCDKVYELEVESTAISRTVDQTNDAVVPSQEEPTTLQTTTEQQEMLDNPKKTRDNAFELQESEDYVEISLNSIRLRSHSLSSSDLEELEVAVDHPPMGTPKSPTVDKSIQKSLPVPSDTGKVLKFLVLWIVALVMAVIVQPDSPYDYNWLIERSSEAKHSLQEQAKECGLYLGGNRGTRCAFERMHHTIKSEVADCHAYLRGETNTHCWVQVSGQAISEQASLLVVTLQQVLSYENFNRISTHCQNLIVQTGMEIRNLATKEYDECQSFFQENQEGTGCSLEIVHDQLKQTKEWIHTQLQHTLHQTRQEIGACQIYLRDREVNTGCSIELVSGEWKVFQQRSRSTLEEVQKVLAGQQAHCQSYFFGDRGTECFLESAIIMLAGHQKRLNTNIVEIQGRAMTVASDYQNYFNDLSGLTNDMMGEYTTTDSESETTQLRVGAESLEDKHADLHISKDIAGEEDQAYHSLPPERPQHNDRRKVNRRKYAESYFDQLEPIPREKTPPRTAFKIMREIPTDGKVEARLECVPHEQEKLDGSKNTDDTMEPAVTRSPVDVEKSHTENKKVTGQSAHEKTEKGVVDNQIGELTIQEEDIPSESILDETLDGRRESTPLKEHVPIWMRTYFPLESIYDKIVDASVAVEPEHTKGALQQDKNNYVSTGDSYQIIDENENVYEKLLEITEPKETKIKGSQAGELDFMKLEYDEKGRPFLVKIGMKMEQQKTI